MTGSGRLIGRGVEPEPATPEDRRVLVLLPGALAEGQPQALADTYGLTTDEATRYLREPLPRVLEVGPDEEAAERADALRAAGVRVEELDAAELLGPLRPWSVEELRLDGDWLRAQGPRGEARVDLRRPALLVVGRLGGPASSFEERFAHLHAGGWSDPIEVVEGSLADGEFLGAERGLTPRANFDALLARLRRWPSVTVDESLLRHADRVQDCLSGLAGADRSGTAADRTNLFSRVHYLLWREALGVRRRELEGGIELLSKPTSHSPSRTTGRRSSGQGALIQPRHAPEPTEPRGGAGASRGGFAPPGFVFRPVPPGSPSISLVVRGLSNISVPPGCMCCLAPTSPRRIEAMASATDWGIVASAVLGLLSIFLVGFGWVYKDPGAYSESAGLRLPACESCFKHETSAGMAWFCSGALSLVGFVMTLQRTGLPTAKLFGLVVVGWLLLFLVIGVVLVVVFSRRGSRCARSRPLKLKFHGADFQVVFGNHAYGEAVADLNPELVVRRV